MKVKDNIEFLVIVILTSVIGNVLYACCHPMMGSAFYCAIIGFMCAKMQHEKNKATYLQEKNEYLMRKLDRNYEEHKEQKNTKTTKTIIYAKKHVIAEVNYEVDLSKDDVIKVHDKYYKTMIVVHPGEYDKKVGANHTAVYVFECNSNNDPKIVID